jgi:AcrR family transcriptional regulator
VKDRRADEGLVNRIADLALERFRIDGFAGTSVADLAGVLGVSKAAICYYYRSKNALLHRLVDPLLDAIDACIDAHSAPNGSAPAARQLLGDYLTVLSAHQDVVPLVATDVAVLNHPTIGGRIRAQDSRLRTLLVAPDTSAAAPLRAEAALGAIRRPLTIETAVDLTDAIHQQTLIDAAVATLPAGRSPPTRSRCHPPGRGRRPSIRSQSSQPH